MSWDKLVAYLGQEPPRGRGPDAGGPGPSVRDRADTTGPGRGPGGPPPVAAPVVPPVSVPPPVAHPAPTPDPRLTTRQEDLRRRDDRRGSNDRNQWGDRYRDRDWRDRNRNDDWRRGQQRRFFVVSDVPWGQRYYNDYIFLNGYGWFPRWFPYWDPRWLAYWLAIFDQYGGDMNAEYASYMRDVTLRDLARRYGWL